MPEPWMTNKEKVLEVWPDGETVVYKDIMLLTRKGMLILAIESSMDALWQSAAQHESVVSYWRNKDGK